MNNYIAILNNLIDILQEHVNILKGITQSKIPLSYFRNNTEKEKFVVQCKTREQAKKLTLAMMEHVANTTFTADPIRYIRESYPYWKCYWTKYWDVYKDQTCIGIGYSSKSWYELNGWQILQFEDIEF